MTPGWYVAALFWSGVLIGPTLYAAEHPVAWLLAGMLTVQCFVPVAAPTAVGGEPSSDAASAATVTPRAPAAPLAWKDLPAGQQELLRSHAKDWDSLAPARQQALARGAQRWLSMDPAVRAAARERFQTWRHLPVERRELIRRRWERFQQLDPESQALVRGNFNAYMRLPPWKRRMLRERWLSATPEERSRMLERMHERHAHLHRPPAP